MNPGEQEVSYQHQPGETTVHYWALPLQFTGQSWLGASLGCDVFIEQSQLSIN